MNKIIRSIDTTYSTINFSFINPQFRYIPNSTLCTQLQGSMHTVVDSTRPLHTQLQSLFLLLPLKTQTYKPRANSSSKRIYDLKPKNCLLHLDPLSIYKIPWSADHGQANTFYIKLNYFRADNPRLSCSALAFYGVFKLH